MTLVIFDIDGTLTDTKAIDESCYLATVKHVWDTDLGEVDWSSFQYVTDTGLAKAIYSQRFGRELTEQELLLFRETFYHSICEAAVEHPHKFREVAGATHFIRELQDRNIAVAIATGGWEVTAKYKLELVGLQLDAFPYATSNDHYQREEIMKLALEQAQKQYASHFTKVIYIGDGVWDYKASQNLEWDFIGIDIHQTGRLLTLGAKPVYRDFEEVDALLQHIKG